MMPPDPDPLQMTQADTERLALRLLPAFLRMNDDGTLAELVTLIAGQYWELHGRLGMLYDAMFIQTCPEAIIPYIAQGIGITGLEPGGAGISQRAWVGRMISFRERKGTLATLGRAVAAATGWPAFVTPGLTTVARTPSVRYCGRDYARWADVGALPPFDPAAAVFQPLTRTADISGQPFASGHQMAPSPAAAGGQPVPGGAGLSVWRLQSFPVIGRTPCPVSGDPRACTFHPMGIDSPLFVEPEATTRRLTPPGRDEIPVPLTRAALRAALREGRVPRPLAVRVTSGAGAAAAEVPASRLAAADLTDWTAPPLAHRDVTAIIDPELGRLLFPALPHPESVVVDYAYGFPGELGGGPYGSAANWERAPSATRYCDVAVSRGAGGLAAPAPPRPLAPPDPLDPYDPAGGEAAESGEGPATARKRVATLEEALAWAQGQDPAYWCIITIGDSATYTAPSGRWEITLAKNQKVRIISAPEAAPALDGELHVHGGDLSLLEISGVQLSGTLTCDGTGQLWMEHATIRPGRGTALRIGGGAASVSFSIVGPVEAAPGVSLSISDTIADGLGGAAITCRRGGGTGQGRDSPGTLDIRRATVLGVTEADILVAEDCLFTGPVMAREARRGLIAYSYQPAGSALPPAVAGRAAGGGRRPRTAADLPRFTSTRFGNPAYGQLAHGCPPEIATGARLGREMGAYNWLRQPARVSRLLDVLDETLPAGRTATVIYRT